MPACDSHQVKSISYLDFFEVERHFAVLAVERSGLTFSIIVSALLRAEDPDFTGLTLDLFKFTAAFVLALKNGKIAVSLSNLEMAITTDLTYFSYSLSHSWNTIILALQMDA